MNLQKQQLKTKKIIGKRLKLSNKTLWNSLSEDQQRDIIDKYYHLFDIKNCGLLPVLNDIRSFRQGLNFLLLSLLLGIFGSMFASIIFKYLNTNLFMDTVIVIAFFIFIFKFSHLIEKISAEEFNENGVLEYLIDLVDKDKRDT